MEHVVVYLGCPRETGGRRTGTLKNEQQKQKGKTARCREAVRRKNLCEPEILRKRFLRRERRDDSKVRERKSAR